MDEAGDGEPRSQRGERRTPSSRAGERAAARRRMERQGTWVDLQVEQAIRRGDFDRLPGFGKPLTLKQEHDPDWWVRGLIQREQVSGVLPPALQLRSDDARLDAELDRLGSEREVREMVEDFNARVRAARYQPLGGPPLITSQRDVGAEVAAWRDRRTAPSGRGTVTRE